MLQRVKQILLLAPSPVMLILGIVSWLNGHAICSAGWLIPEMAVMWFVMAIAHVLPWIGFFEARKYRYTRG